MILTPIYAVIVTLRNLKYNCCPVPKSFTPRVISIGNLSIGGTGKTPLGLWLIKQAHTSGFKAAMLLRGYGHQEGLSDEAELYKSLLGDEHVYVNPNRNESLEKAESQNYDLVFMDDAFQHRKAYRDIDIIVMDVTQPILDNSLMPLGTLREAKSGLLRASVLVLTSCDLFDEEKVKREKERLLSRYPHLKIVEARTLVSGMTSHLNKREWSDSMKVFLFSGIGNPEKFKTTAIKKGLKVVGEKAFRDHHFISTDEMNYMIEHAKSMGAEALVTTAKDAVKIQKPVSMPIFILNIEFEIKKDEPFLKLVFGENMINA